MPRTTGPVSVDYPEDGWLRGYFNSNESDKVNGEASSVYWQKNIDFLRLRDAGLHALNCEPGQVILDLGCADGATMTYCGLQGATVYGQDLDSEMVRKANSLLQRYNIHGEARCGDAANLSFADSHFDGVISSDFFEHISDEGKVEVLKEVYRVLKPGKKLIIKTPNLSYLKLSLRFKQLRGMMRFENPRRYVIPHTPGTADPQHIGLNSRWQLTRSLLEAGFLNYRFFYAPLRRFGVSPLIEILSTEIPVVRDLLCEELFCVAFKPIVLSHFPD